MISLFLFLFVSFSSIYAITDVQQSLVEHVKNSIIKAESGISKLNPEILKIEGMSSAKVRHLLNNICDFNNVKYLEIGTWKGSTFISAMYNNKVKDSIVIDNWSEFSEYKSKESFLINTKKFLPQSQFRFYEANCFALNLKEIFKNKINIYFYDGNHSLNSHKLAFTYFNDILDDNFIAIIDDYNFVEVQKGTEAAFKELKYRILFEKYLPAKHNCDVNNWWNGIYIAVISKQ